MKHIEVVAAIIIYENRILCVQRNYSKYDYISYKYEFPGGKIEAGETKEDAIKREILEELNMDIIIQKEYITVHHDYPDFKISMYSFICSCVSNNLILSEHINFKWLSKQDLTILEWAEADIPIVTNLIKD